MAGPFSTVLFDLDDTLLDSLEARVKALEAVFRDAGIDYPKAGQFLRDLRGHPFKEAIAELAKERGIPGDLFQEYRHHYWVTKKGALRLYPGVREMLDGLHSRGVGLGIVTQKSRKIEVEGVPAGAIEELKDIGILNLFTMIVGFEDVVERKPHPEGIHLALKTLGSGPGETLMVGDSAADIEAAHSAGCFSCYSIWGIPESEHQPDIIKADIIAESPEALLKLDYL